MNTFRQVITGPVISVLMLASVPDFLWAQARPVEVPELNTQFTSSGIRNLRVGGTSDDGTEALLVMEYTYNGNSGPNAVVLPVIENRKQRGVSKWFGSDRVVVPRGRGPISIKVRYFNDEPGAPAALTTDSIRILFLNSTGTAIIGGSTELKTIHWGREGSKAAPAASAADPARDRRLAQLAAEAEERAREKARRAAEAEEQARREAATREAARARAAEEAKSKADARARAEIEAKAKAEERRKAEQQAAVEAKAREEARNKAVADARRLEGERKQAEARAKAAAEAQARARLEAEARQREQERQQAEAEAARLADEKRLADEQAVADAQAREIAQREEEARAAQLEAERKAAEDRAQAEEEARRLAAERAEAEALARRQAEAQAAEAARIKAEQEAIEAARLKAEQEAKAAAETLGLAGGQSRTRITNIDVVNRSLDRSQMTFGIEFDRRDKFSYLGVKVDHTANPGIGESFSCVPKEVGRQKYALVQVAYAHPTTGAGSVVTDRLRIIGSDGPESSDKVPLHTATMLLVWRAPGSNPSEPIAAPSPDDSKVVEITDFRQRSAASGYASLTYHLAEGTGQLRVRLRNSSQPDSASWFVVEPVAVKAGQGLELIPVTVATESRVPGGALTIDTIEAELVDSNGKVIGQATKTTPLTWARD